MLTPFDDYPIHPSADPIAHPASGDPNHYDRYWFNGQDVDGRFFIGGAMGHYPVRDVVDAAFSITIDGVQHSVFASGRMPRDRATTVGPVRIEVLEPLRTVRLSVDSSATGLGCTLAFGAKTAAIEEPRQTRRRDDGVLVMDHTRLTQWGRWSGEIHLDGTVIQVDPAKTVATRDRSWGIRPVGAQAPSNKEFELPQIFWLWAPLHFEGFCTHMALHEHADGRRWLETAMRVPEGDQSVAPEAWTDLTHDIEWEPGTRQLRSATLRARDGAGALRVIEVERLSTFRMRGLGYLHPHWGHGSAHGQLEIGREDLVLDAVDPLDLTALHHQSVVRAHLDGEPGVGVVEQFVLGPHQPTGMTGFTDGWRAS